MTRMDEEDTQQVSDQDIDETEEGSPVPDPRRNEDENHAEDVPTADRSGLTAASLRADDRGVIRRHTLHFTLAACLLVLPGCGWLLGPAVSGGAEASGSSDEEAAAANVRGSIPALEAYYADHSSYGGATADALRAYDYGIGAVQVVPSLDGTSYCIASTVGAATMSKHGPASDLQAGGC
jgi:hypothetical protein